MLARSLLVGFVASWCLCSHPATAQRHQCADDGCDVCLEEGCQGCQVERGRPYKILDTAGSVLGVFDKLALWDRRVRNHNVSPQTEAAVSQYVVENNLHDTKVRINQYAPGDEWRRLRDNKDVGAGWRYTLGAVYTLGYTIFPGRLLGRDSYNPYTDTVSIYSDVPPLALEQAAHAKVVKQHMHPGTYALSYSLPLVALAPEKQAKDEVHRYLSQWGSPDERNEAYDVLTPQFGSEVGGEVGSLFVTGAGTVFELGGAAVGHAVKGSAKPAQRPRRRSELAEDAVFVDDEVQQATANLPTRRAPKPSR
ncbi:MAG: hypothetical protein KDA44_05355 [Planctomycetales bacterium]|nr:hypothetical protein [Planctomycetales bacterium]